MPDLNTQPVVAGVPSVPGSPIVLVVDDDPDVGEATADNLRQAGMRVRTALNADYALDCCQTQPFDAVVLDHHPADGYSEELLEEAPDMGLAVIVSDAKWDVVADIQKRHGASVFGVKVKPVSPADLVGVVQAAVTASRRQPRWVAP
jgi:DNA-binding NtrC family response regulator